MFGSKRGCVMDEVKMIEYSAFALCSITHLLLYFTCKEFENAEQSSVLRGNDVRVAKIA